MCSGKLFVWFVCGVQLKNVSNCQNLKTPICCINYWKVSTFFLPLQSNEIAYITFGFLFAFLAVDLLWPSSPFFFRNVLHSVLIPLKIELCYFISQWLNFFEPSSSKKIFPNKNIRFFWEFSIGSSNFFSLEGSLLNLMFVSFDVFLLWEIHIEF